MKVDDRRSRLAAPIAPSAISSGVIGRYGETDGTWIEPVTAQLTITFPRRAIENLLLFSCVDTVSQSPNGNASGRIGDPDGQPMNANS